MTYFPTMTRIMSPRGLRILFCCFTLVVSSVEASSENLIVALQRSEPGFQAQAVSAQATISALANTEIVEEIRIGSLTYLVAQCSEGCVTQLSSVAGVRYVEENKKVYAFPYVASSNFTDDPTNITVPSTSATSPSAVSTEPPLFCYEQNSGTALWGLTRMVRRTKVQVTTQLDTESNKTPKETDPSGQVYTYSSVDDGKGVDVYVVDSGVHTRHSDFGGRATWDYTHSSLSSVEGHGDKNGHGSHVAGIVAGTTYGAAKRSIVRDVKVLGEDGAGSATSILKGLEYVWDQFKKRTSGGNKPKMVVNMSLGSPQVIEPIDEAVQEMIKEGVIIVVAAGNDYEDACNGSPARVSEAITVGSTDINDRLSTFSNHGACVDILAPGSNIVSVSHESTTQTATLSGTSMATPYVAGIIARHLHTLDYTPTPAEVKSWLLTTGTPDAILGVTTSSLPSNTPNILVYKGCIPGTEYDPNEKVEPSEVEIPWKYAGYAAAGLAIVGSVVGFIVKKLKSRA